MVIDRTTGRWAIYGGMLLGGGGGGDLDEGLRILDLALSYTPAIPLCPLSQLRDEEIVVTASLVGSPASREKYVAPQHYERAFRLFSQGLDGTVRGIITNEMGAQSSTNGWVLAAMTGLPFLDAPCNGRAHPTGVMGSLALCDEPDYVSLQAGVGGKGPREVDVLVRGELSHASAMIRHAATEAGGFVTVIRNPVRADYVAAHAAQGAMARSMEIGRAICEHLGDGDGMLGALYDQIGLKPLCRGSVTQLTLETKGGFDLGRAVIANESTAAEVSFWNEYMTAEQDGVRLATFPELIVVLDAKTGLPQTSAMLQPGMDVVLAAAPLDGLILGSSMRNKRLLQDAEKQIGKELVRYVFA